MKRKAKKVGRTKLYCNEMQSEMRSYAKAERLLKRRGVRTTMMGLSKAMH